MKKQTKKTLKSEEKCCNRGYKGCGGGAYCLGFIGAAVYYFSTATGFWNGVLGLIKAIIWPVFVVYGLLKYLGM